mgnify:CR=1 FL=1
MSTSTRPEIDWDERERVQEAERKEKKKEYMRVYAREWMTKKRQEQGVAYTRGKYVSQYDKIRSAQIDAKSTE